MGEETLDAEGQVLHESDVYEASERVELAALEAASMLVRALTFYAFKALLSQHKKFAAALADENAAEGQLRRFEILLCHTHARVIQERLFTIFGIGPEPVRREGWITVWPELRRGGNTQNDRVLSLSALPEQLTLLLAALEHIAEIGRKYKSAKAAETRLLELQRRIRVRDRIVLTADSSTTVSAVGEEDDGARLRAEWQITSENERGVHRRLASFLWDRLLPESQAIIRTELPALLELFPTNDALPVDGGALVVTHPCVSPIFTDWLCMVALNMQPEQSRPLVTAGKIEFTQPTNRADVVAVFRGVLRATKKRCDTDAEGRGFEGWLEIYENVYPVLVSYARSFGPEGIVEAANQLFIIAGMLQRKPVTDPFTQEQMGVLRRLGILKRNDIRAVTDGSGMRIHWSQQAEVSGSLDRLIAAIRALKVALGLQTMETVPASLGTKPAVTEAPAGEMNVVLDWAEIIGQIQTTGRIDCADMNQAVAVAKQLQLDGIESKAVDTFVYLVQAASLRDPDSRIIQFLATKTGRNPVNLVVEIMGEIIDANTASGIIGALADAIIAGQWNCDRVVDVRALPGISSPLGAVRYWIAENFTGQKGSERGVTLDEMSLRITNRVAFLRWAMTVPALSVGVDRSLVNRVVMQLDALDPTEFGNFKTGDIADDVWVARSPERQAGLEAKAAAERTADQKDILARAAAQKLSQSSGDPALDFATVRLLVEAWSEAQAARTKAKVILSFRVPLSENTDVEAVDGKLTAAMNRVGIRVGAWPVQRREYFLNFSQRHVNAFLKLKSK